MFFLQDNETIGIVDLREEKKTHPKTKGWGHNSVHGMFVQKQEQREQTEATVGV